MAKSDRNSGNRWTPGEIRELRRLARENTPTRVVGLRLGRTPEAVYKKASDERIFAEAGEPESLQSPEGVGSSPGPNNGLAARLA